jgi:hypothetical protein
MQWYTDPQSVIPAPRRLVMISMLRCYLCGDLQKTDDDIQFNFANLSEIFLRAHLLKIDYGGYIVQNKKEVLLPLIEFCPGGGYILSKRSIDVIINNLLDEYTIFEDISIANCLYKQGILPVKLNMYNYTCFW